MSAPFWTLTRSPRVTPSSMKTSRPMTASRPIRAPVRIWARCQTLVPGPMLTSASRSAVAWMRADGSITRGSPGSLGGGCGARVYPRRRGPSTAHPGGPGRRRWSHEGPTHAPTCHCCPIATICRLFHWNTGPGSTTLRKSAVLAGTHSFVPASIQSSGPASRDPSQEGLRRRQRRQTRSRGGGFGDGRVTPPHLFQGRVSGNFSTPVDHVGGHIARTSGIVQTSCQRPNAASATRRPPWRP